MSQASDDTNSCPTSFPEPRVWPAAVIYSTVVVRRLFLRYFTLPRLKPIKVFSDEDPKTGRIQHFYYLVHPWYNPATFWSRWGPTAWSKWLGGGHLPGDDKSHLPEGFLWKELGPKELVGKGAENMGQDVDRMKRMQRGGCPFSGSS